MQIRKLRLHHFLLIALFLCALVGLFGPHFIRHQKPVSIPYECKASFLTDWQAYEKRCPECESLLCIVSSTGVCKSLLVRDLFQDCPEATKLSSCYQLPRHNHVPELAVAISATSSLQLPALAISLLSQLTAHAEILFVVDRTEDFACFGPVIKAIEQLGLPCSSCSGATCHSVIQSLQSQTILAIHDSITLKRGSLGTLHAAAMHLPNSIISPVIVSASGAVAWGLQDSDGLQKVKHLPPVCYIGPKHHMLDTPLLRGDVDIGAAWQPSAAAFAEGSARAFQMSSKNRPFKPAEPASLLRALYIDTNIPTPDKDSGSKRTSALMSLLLEAGFYVTFQPLWETAARYAEQLNDLGIRTLSPGYPQNWATEPIHYDVIFIARRYTYEVCYEAAKQLWPNAKIVYDTVDLHFLREARIKMVGSWFDDETDLASQGTEEVIAWLAEGSSEATEVNKDRETELRFLSQSDVSLVVSDQEVQVVKHYLPSASVHIVSNIMSVDSQAPQASKMEFSRRSGFIFVGHMAHYPNQQALLALVRYIMPEILSRRGWWLRGKAPPVLYVVGSGKLPQDLADALSKQKGIVLLGELTDAQLEFVYASVRVALAPLVSGAGVKGKVNQAMALGVPVVATSIAVEGMHAKSGYDCMVSRTLEEFVDHLERVYFNAGLWSRLAQNGRANVDLHFSPRIASEQLKDVMTLLSLR